MLDRIRTGYTNEINIPRTYNEVISMSVYCHAHPLAVLRPLLARQKIIRAVDLRRLPSDSHVRVIGLLVIVHTPPTKSGKRVMFLTMEDESGLLDVVVFPKAQKGYAKTILTSEVLAIEGRLQRQGKKGISVSVVMERALISWSGKLPSLLIKFHNDLEKTSHGGKSLATSRVPIV